MRNFRRSFLRTGVLVLASAMLLAVPMVSRADFLPHLKLNSSFPASDTTLTTAPDAVRLWFSEPADLPTSRVTVHAADGTALKTAAPTREAAANAPLVVSFVSPPGNGSYKVTWKAMSRDGHVVDGSFNFTVRLVHQ